MKILLTSQTRIADIKQAFSESYPGLKLEFARTKHAVSEGSAAEEMVLGNPELELLAESPVAGELEVRSTMTVSEVEQLFQTKFNLSVQIFRKSGLNWLQTVTTDSLTLKELVAKSAS